MLIGNERWKFDKKYMKKLKGVSSMLTSIFFYLKDCEKYNVYFDYAAGVLMDVFPGLRLDFEDNYDVYNEVVNWLKACLCLWPQEVDFIFSRL